MNVEFINPFISSALNVFSTMLGTRLERGPLSLKSEQTPVYEVSGLIGLCGRCQGMVVVNVGAETAIGMAAAMLGYRPASVDGEVMDAVGEVTNMVAGAAKVQLAKYEMSIGLPTVIYGSSPSIKFPAATTPIVIPFTSDLGPVSIEVAFVETPQRQAAAGALAAAAR